MLWTMLAGLAIQVQQTAPVPARPAMVSPQLRAASAKQKGDARALLARARAAKSGYRPKAGQPSIKEMDDAIASLQARLDSLSEMTEMDQMRLQKIMDARAKAMEMLSNILKKSSDTQGSIIKNMQ